jgi:signal peptidase I
MFTAKWKKEAKLLVKGARKFVNYKRDLLQPDRIAEIESRQDDLIAAIKAGDRDKVAECSKQLRNTCEKSLRGYEAPNWWEENIEVMFVAIVIALGLRTYVLQPFRIPTGSMQPTLNGIVGHPLPEDQWPAMPTRMAEWALKGRSYVKVVNDRERTVRSFEDIQHWHFFSRSRLTFTDGSSIILPAPRTQIQELGFDQVLAKLQTSGGVLKQGEVICEGTVDAGDLVLVDRMSYHFRKPVRGEVFVFDTRGIEGTNQAAPKKGNTHLADQAEGTHYIKRLAAVPGDTLEIAPPNILISGEVAREPGFEYVYQLPLTGTTDQFGYSFARPWPVATPLLFKTGDKLELRADGPSHLREYAALGDNSGNSLDSRYWGTVKEFNLVGPALFSLWPFTSGHWGIIR